jgi:hypothetical protein
MTDYLSLLLSTSSVPLTSAIYGATWLWLSHRAVARNFITGYQRWLVVCWIFVLSIWGGASAFLAVSGFYSSAAFLALLPGLWWVLIPMAVTASFAAMPAFRGGLIEIVRQEPKAIIALQVLRITAIGSVFKAANGLLPVWFAGPIGVLDALFGLSAIWLLTTWPKDGRSPRQLIVWNAAGVALLFATPLMIQMGLPGPLYILTSLPDASALFEYPMVLAPTLIVPLFLVASVIQILVLWQQSRRRAPVEIPDNLGAAR